MICFFCTVKSTSACALEAAKQGLACSESFFVTCWDLYILHLNLRCIMRHFFILDIRTSLDVPWRNTAFEASDHLRGQSEWLDRGAQARMWKSNWCESNRVFFLLGFGIWLKMTLINFYLYNLNLAIWICESLCWSQQSRTTQLGACHPALGNEKGWIFYSLLLAILWYPLCMLQEAPQAGTCVSRRQVFHGKWVE